MAIGAEGRKEHRRLGTQGGGSGGAGLKEAV